MKKRHMTGARDKVPVTATDDQLLVKGYLSGQRRAGTDTKVRGRSASFAGVAEVGRRAGASLE